MGCHEVLNLGYGLDAAAGAHGRAVEGGGGAGEFELALQWPTLQKTKNKTCVKSISRPGGVDRIDAIGRSVVKLPAIPCKDAMLPERGCGEEASVALVDLWKRLVKVGVPSQASGNVAAGYEEIDVR